MSEIEQNSELEELQTQTEDEEEDDDDSLPEQFKMSVVSTNLSIEFLVKLYKEREIYIPEFQRGYVWKLKQASRLIESLLLGFPVPPLFLAKEEDQRMIVIDGNQRLQSIVYFYENRFKKSKCFNLKGVIDKYNGKRFDQLEAPDQRRFKNYPFPVIIIEPKEEKDRQGIYYIFERLNTGGTNLKPQEIRACIYHGALNELIVELDENEEKWREIFYGEKKEKQRETKKKEEQEKIPIETKETNGQEMILRFLAIYYDNKGKKEYKGYDLKQFLNQWMAKNRNPSEEKKNEMRNIFTSTINVIYKSVGKDAFKRIDKRDKKFIPAYFESIMVAVAERVEAGGEIRNTDGLIKKYKELVDTYQKEEILKERKTEKFRKMLEMAREAFKDIE
ncbi:MAG: DUF262 domain-containing protein [Oscillatoriaceae bacterium SKYG93]|nr:DUF262 domain-containing protein [Oscillatoriaceae bacterium SKYG93]MDW8454737.1 DUF262 domain-containing protein [Oscillatoriaceae cyanobacterium SKYGB_i_bin93]